MCLTSMLSPVSAYTQFFLNVFAGNVTVFEFAKTWFVCKFLDFRYPQSVHEFHTLGISVVLLIICQLLLPLYLPTRFILRRNLLIFDAGDSSNHYRHISGLLKEYLRELPEPVFSSCLYQMLVDAMGVFLPDDPDGNAKLVFSILDCLPKANRVSCFYLKSHELRRATNTCQFNFGCRIVWCT